MFISTKRLMAAGVLLWSLGASCQRQSPQPDPTAKSCSDATCCHPDTYKYDYIEYIRDMPANITFGGGNLFMSTPVPTLKEYQYKADYVQICGLSYAKVKGLETLSETGSPPGVYRYKVSGKLFHNASWRVFSVIPSLSFYVDKIEENR